MGTIADKLDYLTGTKELFKDRLNSLGAEITSSTTFRNYLAWLDTFYEEVSDKTDLSVNGVVGRTSQDTLLPSEYTQVDYIESSGTQYIDTGVNADYKLSIKTEFSNLSQSSYQGSMSGNNATNRVRHHLQITSTGNVVYWAGLTDAGCSITLITETNYDSSKKYNIFADIYNQKYYLDGTEISGNFNSNNFDTGLNYYLFGRNTNNVVSNMVSMKMYSCKIYYNNVLVRDFIPCYRNSDNEVGLYDLVNNVFYTNQGTGAFTYSSVVGIPNPDYPQPINNLSGDVDYKVSGKNLCPTNISNWEQGTISSGVNSDSTTRIRTIDYYPIKNDINYHVSTKNTDYRFLNIHLYDNEKEFINQYYSINTAISNTYDLTINIPSSIAPNVAYMRVTVRKDNNQTITVDEIESAKPQIELGSISTDFEPYIEPQTFTIPLGDIELGEITTYEDKIYSSNGRFYLKKNIAKLTFNGSETWNKSNITGSVLTQRFRTTQSITMVSNLAVCDKFINRTSGMSAGDYECFLVTNNTSTYISINIDRLTENTAQAFKTWLSNNNVTAYVVLATPTTTEITQNNYPLLYNALKQIQDYLTSYKINKEFILGYSSPEIEY